MRGWSKSSARRAAVLDPGYAVLRDERTFVANASAWREAALPRGVPSITAPGTTWRTMGSPFTVAMTTAAGIVAPLAGTLSPTHTALLALAIGAGSLFLSHVNDAGFWLVKELFGLTVGQTFRSWSVMETAVSLVGFGFVMLLSALF